MGGKPSSEVRSRNTENPVSEIVVAGSRHTSLDLDNTRISIVQHRSHAQTSLSSNQLGEGRLRARSLAENVHRNQAYQPSLPTSPTEENASFRRRSTADGSSLTPLHMFAFHNLKCPICHKSIQTDDIECHLVMCLTKPKISYNDDILLENKGECVICFEDMSKGDKIARLPCLCIYHKRCIDSWFKINRCCPEHPGN